MPRVCVLVINIIGIVLSDRNTKLPNLHDIRQSRVPSPFYHITASTFTFFPPLTVQVTVSILPCKHISDERTSIAAQRTLLSLKRRNYVTQYWTTAMKCGPNESELFIIIARCQKNTKLARHTNINKRISTKMLKHKLKLRASSFVSSRRQDLCNGMLSILPVTRVSLCFFSVARRCFDCRR